MKKKLICVLFVIISLFGLSSCGVSLNKIVTKEELEEFINEKDEYFNEIENNGYSYKFDYTYKYKYGKNKQTVKATGKANYSPTGYNKSEFYIKEKISQTYEQFYNNRIVKTKVSATVESVYVGGILYNKANTKVSSKFNTTKENIKEKSYTFSSDLEEYQNYIESIIDMDIYGEDTYIIIKGNSLVLVYSTFYEHVEVTMKFKDNKLSSIKYYVVTSDSTLKMNVKIVDSVTITEPSNPDDYKNV